MIPTFDLEVVGWSVPIAVGFYDGFDYYEFIKEDETDDVLWKFLTYIQERHQGTKLYAHCAAKFDNKFILASLCNHGQTVSIEAGLLRLKWREADITFEDSYAVLPVSLKRAAKMFGAEDKKEWDHTKNLNPWQMGEQLATFKAYLKTDCISLSLAMDSLCTLLGQTFNITPSITLSTTAVKAFDRCFHNVNLIYSNEEFEAYIRRATHGGRNEIYKRYGENIYLYDVKSMFVSCYDTPVPVGKLRWVKPNMDKGTLAEASVKVPKDFFIGPLPHKLNGRLTFPVGEFTDWWDMTELRLAAEQGVDISIRRQLYCEEEPILKDFGELIGKLRTTELISEYWKMFGLSLSGKFGQGRWRDKIVHLTDVKDFKGLTPLDRNEEYFQFREYTSGRAPYIKPAISMRVRSEARVRHLRWLLEAFKLGDVFYGDTDSVYTTARMPVGKNVGNLVYIGKASRGYFIRQKLYALIMGKKIRQRSAGFSDLKLSEEDFKTLLRGEILQQGLEELPSYRSILKAGEVTSLSKIREIRLPEDENRIIEGDSSRPICLPQDLRAIKLDPLRAIN